jgi:Peptidase family M1 domain
MNLQRLLATCILLVLTMSIVSAQNKPLFVPRNIQKTYDNGTRQRNGKPGPKYWQNHAKYDMQVRIDPATHHLYGTSTVTYFNQSPDSLKTIRIKLQHDLYKRNGQRANDMAAGDIDEGVNLKSVTMNGTAVNLAEQRRFGTFLDIKTGAQPLAPGRSVNFTFEWDYRLPKDEGAPRECVCDSTTFFVAYWYPQVAVYDDIRGWADMPYNGTQEFYHDFADYDVTVTMPHGYQVWATGEWQNAEEVLSNTVFQRWKNAHEGSEVVKIFTEDELKTKELYKQRGKVKAFRFKASNVPDFAFAASDHFNWDATSVEVERGTGRRVFVSAAYDTKSKDYPRVAQIAADGIKLMSTWQPGYPFPYPTMTVFNGNDGMEYPMMCNDASVREDFVTSLTVHEISHTYFPFMMGTNEQEYAWMDEGWAAFFDYMLADSMSNGKEGNVRGYANAAGFDVDVPPMVKNSNLRGRSYGIAAYQRPQAAYLILHDMLGEATFRKCMVEYMDRWKGKHPMPYDFFNTWSEVSGQDLDWFWQPWFFEIGLPDVAIGRVESVDNAGTVVDMVTVEMPGQLPIPIHLDIEYTDGTLQNVHHPANIWRSGNSEVRVFGQPGKKFKSLTLSNLREVPDAVKANNTWTRP